MASCLTSLRVDLLDRPWLDTRLERYGRKRPVVWIITNARELHLGNFIYEPATGRLSDPLVGFEKTLAHNDELRDYLDDWFNVVKSEEAKHG